MKLFVVMPVYNEESTLEYDPHEHAIIRTWITETYPNHERHAFEGAELIRIPSRILPP